MPVGCSIGFVIDVNLESVGTKFRIKIGVHTTHKRT